MALVDHIHFVAALGGPELHALDDLAGVLDRGVRGGIHLDHVHGAALGDRHARGADPAGAPAWVRIGAVYGLGEQPGHGGFANAARASKEVGVGHALLHNGVAQGLDHMLLAYELVEGLGAPLAIK